MTENGMPPVAVLGNTKDNYNANSNLRTVKTIYQSKGGKSKEMVTQILELAIDTHITKNPGLYFEKLGKPVKNNDKSTSYTLYFTKVKPVKANDTTIQHTD